MSGHEKEFSDFDQWEGRKMSAGEIELDRRMRAAQPEEHDYQEMALAFHELERERLAVRPTGREEKRTA
jgi:hypothetical protein